MIRVVHWNAAAGKGQVVPVEYLPADHTAIAEGDTIWIDLVDPTPEEEEQVFGRFLVVHPLTREDIIKPRREPEQGAHLPKVEEFDDYLFCIVNPLPDGMAEPTTPSAPGTERRTSREMIRSRPQLSAVLSHALLITHHYDKLNCVETIRNYVQRHASCSKHGPDYLFHLVLDAMVDEYAPVVDRIADQLDTLEVRMFRKPAPQILQKLLRIKREVSFLRKTLILERNILYRLIQGEFSLVAPEEIAYYRNVNDHLIRYAELTESAREMVSDMMQTHLAAVSNRLNEVMKVLTMISTTVLPMTLIAGIYGMNFEQMPELKSTWGYPMALGLMVLTGIGSFWYFRRKGWI